jgi:hypothetical protein
MIKKIFCFKFRNGGRESGVNVSLLLNFRKSESTQLKGVHNSNQIDPLPLPKVVYGAIDTKMVFVHLAL